MTKPITIVGGGLAGLALGIGLRQRGVPVTIHEAGHYPRHRVCGEFISGRGQATLARLELRDLIENSGAVSARSAAFFSATKSGAPLPLPAPATCLSRFILDAALAKKFRELGGELCEGSRSKEFGEGIVHATGRRPPSGETGPQWFGLKVHARNVKLAADLELHVSHSGYVGLCRINDGEVNVCGLFKKTAGESPASSNRRELLCGPSGSPIRQRLAEAEFVENSYCAVAGLSLRPQHAAAQTEICIGDTITMIPPMTGNGMSMALESAELAAGPLAGWSRGEATWAWARQKIARECDALFSRRLAWAKWLQRMILTPALQNPAIVLAERSRWFWRMAFDCTR